VEVGLMARRQRGPVGAQGGPGGGRRRPRGADRFRPRKYTRINVEQIDYKDLATLRRFISDRGKVRSRRVTGLSRRHQKQLAVAVKRAREIALLPYVGER
jgi:small subunit ribosomal protein S18